MPVVADVLPHIVATLHRDINHKRDLRLSRIQIEHLFRRDREPNAACGDWTARGDLSGEVQLHRRCGAGAAGLSHAVEAPLQADRHSHLPVANSDSTEQEYLSRAHAW